MSNYSDRDGMEQGVNKDLDDPGAVFGQHKRAFLIAGLIALIVAVVVILYLTKTISLLVADCILSPVAVIFCIVYFFKTRRR